MDWAPDAGIGSLKEVLSLAQDPVNYPIFAKAFQESFKGQMTPGEMAAVLTRFSVFLKRIRGNAATFDESDPRRRLEAKKR